MKKFLFSIFVIFLSININLLGQTVEIGTGSSTQYLGGLYGFEYYGLLYDASEIGNTTSSMTISAIEFNVYSINTSNTLTYQIYMKATNATQLYSCGTEYFSNYTNGATQVFNGSGVLNATGWQTINLNTPFTLPAGSNLLIAIKATSSSTSGGCSRMVFCTTVTNNRFWYTWKDYTDQGASACGSSSTCTNTRPNIRLITSSGGGGGGTEPCADYIIGTGTSGQTYFPLYSFYGYNYSQQIYTASELNAVGITNGIEINSIAFYYTNTTSSTTFSNWNNWTVYIANTNKSNFASTSDWIPISNFSQVFSGIIPISATEGWVTLNFTTPYVYTGQNLCIAVDENSSSYSSGANFRYTATSDLKAILYYSDATNPNPASPPTANYTNSSKYRANIKINACGENVTPTNTHNVPSSGNNTWTTCEGHLYDSGGATGNYANSCTGYTVIYPSTAGANVSVSGTLYAESGNDYLSFYDGVGTTATLIQTVYGSGTNILVNINTITSTNGPLTVKFTSDGSIVGAGFDLTVSCTTDGGGGTEPCADYIIGTGTSGQTYFPLYSFYGYNYSQQIYTASELNAVGITNGMEINSIAFYYTNTTSSTTFSNWNNWTVYIANTNKSNFASTSDWIPISNFSQVFSGIIPISATEGWVTLNFTTPYVYTGQNLCIAVDENSSSYSSGANFRYTATSDLKAILYYSDATNPNPASPPTANYSNSSKYRANIKINACNPCVNINLSADNNTINCNTNSSTITATIDSDEDYTLAWSNSETTDAITVTTPNTYTVTVTTNTCSISQSITIDGNITPPTVNIQNLTGSTQIDCQTNSQINLNALASGGSGNYSYEWNGGNTPQNANNIFTTGGTYVVTVIDNTSSCFNTASVTLTQLESPNLLTADISPLNICIGEAISFTGNATAANFINLYNSATAGNIIAQTPIGETASYTPTAPGTYTFYLAAGAGATGQNCETNRIAFNVVVNSLPLASINNLTGDNIVNCNTTSINVLASGGNTYQWSGGLSNNTPTNQLVEAGMYFVTATDNSTGCSAIDSIFIVVDADIPTASITVLSESTHISCLLSEVNVVINDAENFQVEWSGGNNIEGNTNTFVTGGNYSVTVTNPDNACSNTASINITEDLTMPVINFTSSSENNELNCSVNSITINTNVQGNNNIYNWSGGNSPSQADNTFSQTGIYYVTVTNVLSHCQSIDSVVIRKTPDFIAHINVLSEIACYGDNAIFTIDAIGGIQPYQGIGVYNVPAGEYNYTVTDASGCIQNLSITFDQPDEFVLNIIETAKITCYNDNTAALSAEIIGGSLPYSYTWNYDNSFVGDTETINNLSAGSYSLTVSDQTGCSITKNYQIEQAIPIAVSYDYQDVKCYGKNNGSVEFNATGGVEPYTYAIQWNNQTIQGNKFNGLRPNTYKFIVEDKNNCKYEGEFTIHEPDQINASYNTKAVSCQLANDGKLEIFAQGGNPPYYYFLNDKEITAKNNNIKAGKYNLIIKDTNNCELSINNIVIENNYEDCLFIPEAFSPNGDGVNDTWVIDGLENFESFEIRVFNRWGEILFKKDDITQEPWDGKYKNKQLPIGTYLYVIQTNNDTKYTGSLTIIY